MRAHTIQLLKLPPYFFVVAGILIIFFHLPVTVYALSIEDGAFIDGVVSWDMHSSPYSIEGDMVIGKEGALTITKGAVVLFSPGARIYVDGQLTLAGSEDFPIELKEDPSKEGGDWGIDVVGGSLDANHIVWQGGSVFAEGAAVSFDHSRVAAIHGDFIGGYKGSTIQIAHSAIGGVQGNIVGIYDGGQAVIAMSTLKHGFRSGISVYDGMVNIDRLDCSGGLAFIPCVEFYGDSYGSIRFSDFAQDGTAIYNGSTHVAAASSLFARQNWWNGSTIYDEIEGGTDSSNPLIRPASTTHAVLFFPGIKASRLFSESGQKVWEPFSHSDIETLSLASTTSHLIYANDIVDTIPFVGDIYATFTDFLSEHTASGTISGWDAFPYDWRFDPSAIVMDKKIYLQGLVNRLASSSPSGKTVIIAHSYGGLIADAFIDQIRGVSVLGDFIKSIVYVAVPHKGAFTAILSLMHGYGEAIGAGLILTEYEARAFARWLPSVYRLVPNSFLLRSMSTLHRGLVFFDKASPLFASYQDISTAEQVFAFMRGITMLSGDVENNEGDGSNHSAAIFDVATTSASTPLAVVPSLFNAIQNSVDTTLGEVVHDGINRFSIVGTGRATVGGIRYGTKKKCRKGARQDSVGSTTNSRWLSVSSCIAEDVPYYTPLLYADGDGVVQDESARTTREGEGVESVFQNPYATISKNFFINLGDRALRKIQHGNMLSALPVQEVIASILTEVPLLASNTAVSIASTTIASTTARGGGWRIGIHSPLESSVIDRYGNVTGQFRVQSTSTDIATDRGISIEVVDTEDISGGYFTKTNDDMYIMIPAEEPGAGADGLPLLSLPGEYQMVLRGTGISIATVTIEYFAKHFMDGEGTPAQTWTFGPFPVHAAWVGEIVLPFGVRELTGSEASTTATATMTATTTIAMATTTAVIAATPDVLILRVDADDDGMVDFIIRPNAPIPDRIFAMTTHALLDTLCIPSGARREVQDSITKVLTRSEQGGYATTLFPRDYPVVTIGAYRGDEEIAEGDAIYEAHLDIEKAGEIFAFIKSIWKGSE